MVKIKILNKKEKVVKLGARQTKTAYENSEMVKMLHTWFGL